MTRRGSPDAGQRLGGVLAGRAGHPILRSRRRGRCHPQQPGRRGLRRFPAPTVGLWGGGYGSDLPTPCGAERGTRGEGCSGSWSGPGMLFLVGLAVAAAITCLVAAQALMSPAIQA